MFTTCDSWCDHEGKKFECHAALPPMFILLLRSVPLVFTKFTKPWSCQKTKFYFSMLLTTPWSWKKLFTLSLHKNCLHKKCINCYYIHYAAIMAKKYIFSFQQYYIHYALMLKKKTFSPIANCYYIHYIRIMSKTRIPMGCYVHYDHDKNISFYFSTTCTTPWPWQQIYFFSIIISISVLHSLGSNNEKKFPHCYYVHYMAIFFFFDAATFTTLWLALHPLCPG